MGTAPYAIETQSTLWVVAIEHGPSRHEKETRYLFFRGSDPEEVWGLLCRYLDDIYEKTADRDRADWACVREIVLDTDDHVHTYVSDPLIRETCVGITKRYVVKNAVVKEKKPHEHECDAPGLVRIKRMDVIEFRK